MSKREKTPPVVIFAILSVITVFVWVGFETYRAFTKDPTPTVPLEVTRALDPTLDEEQLADVVRRINLTEDEIGDTTLVQPETPEPTETPALTQTEEPVETTETALESGGDEQAILEELDQLLEE